MQQAKNSAAGAKKKDASAKSPLPAGGSFSGSLLVRLALVIGIGLPLVISLCAFLYPYMMVPVYQQVASKLAADAAGHEPSASEVLNIMGDHNLGWYYISTADGKVLPGYQPYFVDLGEFATASRKVNWKGSPYYEAVAPVGSNQVLHAGFHAQPFVGDWLGQFLVVILLVASLIFMMVAVFYLAVQTPLKRIVEYCKNVDVSPGADGSLPQLPPMTAGAGSGLAVACAEVLAAAKAVEDVLRRLLSAFERNAQDVRRAAAAQYEDQILSAQRDLADFRSKDLEDKFINKLARDVEALNSSDRICHAVLHELHDEFPSFIKSALSFKFNDRKEPRINAQLGFNSLTIEAFTEVGQTRPARDAVAQDNLVVVQSEELKEYGFERFSAFAAVDSVIYVPLCRQNRSIALLAIPFFGSQEDCNKVSRVLKKVAEIVAKTLYRVVMYEQEFQANRTDPLTGLSNRKYLHDLMKEVFSLIEQSPEGRCVSFLLVEGDNFMALNSKYGRQYGDDIIREFAAAVRKTLRLREPVITGGYGDHMIRYGAAQFLLVMEDIDAEKALAIGERVRKIVEKKEDWPGGLPAWSTSIGVSTYPEDGTSGEQMMSSAECALAFLKEHKEQNKVIHCAQIPRAFKSKKQGSTMGGTLEVFEPGALLQSLYNAQKSGILEVGRPDGLKLWAFIESGKPVKARLGKFGGDTALVEFITLFEEGSFTFKEHGDLGREDLEEMARMGEAFDVKRSLERDMLDGALARDHLQAARIAVPRINLFVSRVTDAEGKERLDTLKTLPDPPSSDELAAMSEIWKLASGSSTLQDVFQKMDTTPTHRLWRCAALMLENKLLKLSSIRLYAVS